MRRYLQNVSWRLVANVLAIGVSAAAFPLVARRLGAEAYGQLAIVTGFAGLVGQIVGLRLWDAVVKFLAEFVARDDSAGAWALVRLMYLLDAGTAALVLAVLIAAAPTASSVLLRAPLAWLFALAGLQIFCGVTSGVSTAILRLFDRFRFLSAVDVAATLGRSALVLTLVFAGWGVAGALVAYAIAQAAQSAVLFFVALSALRQKFVAPLSGAIRNPLRGRLREIFKFLFNLNIDTYRKAITGNADTLIIGYFAPPAAVGVYKVARQLAGYIGQLSNPLYEAIYPEIARDWYGPGRARVIGLIERLSLAIGLGLAAGGLASLWAARPLFDLVFGADYAGALPLFLILIWSNVWLIFVWAPGLMFVVGRAGEQVRLNLISSLVSLALMILLAKWYGAPGVALALVANFVVWTAGQGLLLWRSRKAIFQAA